MTNRNWACNRFQTTCKCKCKCKSVPLQTRGAQRFPGSSSSQILWQCPRMVVTFSTLRTGCFYQIWTLKETFFEIWTNQEDLKESYTCRSERTLAKIAMQIQHRSVCTAPLAIYGGLQPDWHICYFLFCKCSGIWTVYVQVGKTERADNVVSCL